MSSSITDNDDIVAYGYLLAGDLDRLVPYDDDPLNPAWTHYHEVGWQMVLDDLAIRGIAETSVADTTNLKRPAACWATRTALALGGSIGTDANSVDAKRVEALEREYHRLMGVISLALTSGNAIRPQGEVRLVQG